MTSLNDDGSGADPAYVKRVKQRDHMRIIWMTAIFNMPWRDDRPVPEASEFGNPNTKARVGQLHALADCLEMKPHLVKRSMIHGATPKKPETLHLLERFASHYGTRFAGIRLAAVGALHKYPSWPRRG